jgi:putative ABC transport system permease protein
VRAFWDQSKENIAIAMDTLRTSRLRTGLTILGVVIGVTTVMTMATIVEGIKQQIVRSFEVAGPNTYYVLRQFGAANARDARGAAQRSRPAVTIEEAEAIAELPHVAYAGIWVRAQGRIEYLGTRTQQLAIWGSDNGFSVIQGGDLVAGRWFAASELRGGSAVAVLDSDRARQVFGQIDPLGRTVSLGGRPVTVVGLYQPVDNIFQPQGQEVGAIVPFRFAYNAYRVDRERSLWIPVKPRDGVTVATSQDEVALTLRVMRGLRPAEGNTFDLVTQGQVLDTFNRVTDVFFLIMIALASVALLVGGIGVMAIMMVSVTARTREIGVRMALGATRRDILVQFLTESATLTGIGGLMGIGVGLLAGRVLTVVIGIQAETPLAATLAAVIGSALIGITFGMLPAMRASKLDPVDALRYE